LALVIEKVATVPAAAQFNVVEIKEMAKEAIVELHKSLQVYAVILAHAKPSRNFKNNAYTDNRRRELHDNTSLRVGARCDVGTARRGPR
jgi:hypothetical protein